MEAESTIGILDEFQTDLVNGWRQLTNKGFFFLLLAAWLALFHFFGNSTLGFLNTPSLLTWMYNVGTGSFGEGETDDHQMMIAPLVVLGLFWWKRKELLGQPVQIWWQGLILVGLGLLMHVVGYRVQQPRISIVALFTGIYGLMGLAWGPKLLRASFFPFFLFIFCVPFGTLAEFVTFPLRQIATSIVAYMTHGIGVIHQGTELIDAKGNFQFEVAPACGGIRSLIMTVMLATVYGFISFPSLWKRLLLIALALPLAVAGNVLRLLVVVGVAKICGQNAAMTVHNNTLFMLLPYVPAILALLWVGSLLEKKPVPAVTAEPSEVAA